MDGARLLNAVVAARIPAREFAAPFDRVWIDLTKGLGAPVGAVLAGSRDFIEAAWVFKQRFGGAMRQAGIVAAAGSMRWTITWTGWPRITSGPAGSRPAWPSFRAWPLTRIGSRPTS